ncbi:MAG: hypothetical protein F2534_16360 [Actinobacteria bacterium]|uniref:Unannotated protein n=1 Tax=freshwater metagenome TaxID=449393 RepID=A0A6J6F070_9ZZZZ|nr:hypothetical protein [Actinomycetota bacterium]
MNDLLDDRLRTMMRTATADAPEAPTVDDLQTITVVGAEPRQRSMRPIAAAAAVMAVAAAGALVWWPSGDGGPQPADTPDSTEAGVVPGSYLDAYYLPTDLPDGWQIVEMRRSPGFRTESSVNAVVFERRDRSDRALVTLSPTPTGSELPASTEPVDGAPEGSALASGSAPATTEAPEQGKDAQETIAGLSPATAQWIDDAQSLVWSLGDWAVLLATRSSDEASARALALDLLPQVTASGPSFDVKDASEWVEVREYLLTQDEWAGSNTVVLAHDDGRMLTVAASRPTGIDPLELASPLPEPGLFRYRTSPDDVGLVRRDGDLLLDFYGVNGPVATDETQRAIAIGMRRVTEAEWLEARPDLNEVVAAATVVGTFELLDHTVTAHREGGISGVCVERADGVSGCALLLGVEPDGELPAAAPTQGIPLSDGTWVAVGSIANGLEPCEEPLLQGARASVVPNGDVQTMLVVPADLDASFACPLVGVGEGEVAPNEVFIANPPPAD